jgi:hemolysin III
LFHQVRRSLLPILTEACAGVRFSDPHGPVSFQRLGIVDLQGRSGRMHLFDFREPVNAWSHLLGAVLALPGTYWLLRGCGRYWTRRLSLLIYGASLALCYGFSALFHGSQTTSDRLQLYYLLDHIGIYILIAGTYTPIACNLLKGRWQTTTLALVWLAAAAGASLHLVFGKLPPWLFTVLYLAMGWGAVFCYREISQGRSHRVLRPIVVGGVLYSIGAMINLLKWPALWPGVFASHELFHLFVLAGSFAHFAFMQSVVVPASWEPVEPTVVWPQPNWAWVRIPIALRKARHWSLARPAPALVHLAEKVPPRPIAGWRIWGKPAGSRVNVERSSLRTGDPTE